MDRPVHARVWVETYSIIIGRERAHNPKVMKKFLEASVRFYLLIFQAAVETLANGMQGSSALDTQL